MIGLVTFASLAALVVPQAASSAGPQAPAGAPDRYIITLKSGATPEAVASSHGIARAFTYKAAINGFAGEVPAGRLDALRNDPRIAGVHIDRPVHAIGGLADEGITANGKGKPAPTPAPSGQVVPENIKRIGAAPGATGYTGAGVSIAILDSGLDLANQDLNIAASCYDAFGGNCSDGNGHGTHVAGIAAARNNSIGVVGAAPDATVVAVRVLDDSGSGTDATVLAGIDWIMTNKDALGIRVINASLGRPGTVDDNPALRDAVTALKAAGIVLVVAAGNAASTDTSNQVPSAYPEALAIASTTAIDGSNGCRSFPGKIGADTASYFTSDGTKVLVSAPGEERENISKGCLIQSVGVLSLKAGGGITRMSGTSMAAPAATGVAALLVQKNPSLTPDQYASALGSADRASVAPLNSPARSYTFDGVREGVVFAPNALSATP